MVRGLCGIGVERCVPGAVTQDPVNPVYTPCSAGGLGAASQHSGFLGSG